MAGPVGFVGRERELSRLRVALGGDTRLVLVVGDAGVGKTRFAGEGMRRAAGRGKSFARVAPTLAPRDRFLIRDPRVPGRRVWARWRTASSR